MNSEITIPMQKFMDMDKNSKTFENLTTDPIVLSVMQDSNNRSLFGLKKYNCDLSNLTEKERLQHAYEEALDLCNYLKGLIIEKNE